MVKNSVTEPGIPRGGAHLPRAGRGCGFQLFTLSWTPRRRMPFPKGSHTVQFHSPEPGRPRTPLFSLDAYFNQNYISYVGKILPQLVTYILFRKRLNANALKCDFWVGHTGWPVKLAYNLFQMICLSPTLIMFKEGAPRPPVKIRSKAGSFKKRALNMQSLSKAGKAHN